MMIGGIEHGLVGVRQLMWVTRPRLEAYLSILPIHLDYLTVLLWVFRLRRQRGVFLSRKFLTDFYSLLLFFIFWALLNHGFVPSLQIIWCAKCLNGFLVASERSLVSRLDLLVQFREHWHLKISILSQLLVGYHDSNIRLLQLFHFTKVFIQYFLLSFDCFRVLLGRRLLFFLVKSTYFVIVFNERSVSPDVFTFKSGILVLVRCAEDLVLVVSLW